MFDSNTKASILEYLKTKIKSSIVDDFIFFDVHDWETDREGILNAILEKFNSEIVIVRSSTLEEDQIGNASAGKYLSILDINTNVVEQLIEAINKVVGSFIEKENFEKRNQVIVQLQVRNPMIAGVAFTKFPKSCAPYYIIEYDESGTTNNITGFGKRKRKIIYRGVGEADLTEMFGNLLQAFVEIEKVLRNNNLILEFAIDHAQNIHIFQVKELKLPGGLKFLDPEFDFELKNVIDSLHCSKKNGMTFSNMADWNPAEMIGPFPSTFSYSLYKELITDESWAIAREELGYKSLEDSKLMVSIAGKPYINIRKSLISLLPEFLPDTLMCRIVDDQLEKLSSDPSQHDKIEFGIAILENSFDRDDLSQVLGKYVDENNSEDYIEKWISFHRELLLKALKMNNEISNVSVNINNLRKRIQAYDNSFNPKVKLNEFIDDLKVIAVIPFAKIARIAFWSKGYLNWCLKEQSITSNELELFYGGLGSMPFSFQEVLSSLNTKQPSNDLIGNLRAQSYDITSRRYDEVLIDGLELTSQMKKSKRKVDEFKPPSSLLERIDKFLYELKLDWSSDVLLKIIGDAIVNRELIKFQYSQVLSDLIESFAELGKRVGLSRQELSFLNIDTILTLDGNIKRSLNHINKNIGMREIHKKILLPSFIDFSTNILNYEIPEAHPNFITNKVVQCESIIVTKKSDAFSNLINGKIVIIEAADTGFDWIFLFSIKGLVTKYGGVASHMAVRCHELGIPAAIGCGEIIFDDLINSNLICIDASSELVYKIS